jgi:hypothetical protein
MGNLPATLKKVLPDNNSRIDTFMKQWTEPIVYFLIFAGLGMKCNSKFKFDMLVLRAVL